VSALRAKCPDCRTLTAVAVGPEYQCHSCGREFAAGLVRVPRAWGAGGEAMAAAATMALPWPEAATIDEPTLERQVSALARELPARPLVLGGCCCAHVGAVRELARRHGRLGVVWIDAGDVAACDVTLLGARNLDPPEVEFIRQSGIHEQLGELPERVYVALDCDVFEPGSLDAFMPEPGGSSPAGLEPLLASIPAPAGAGLTGLLGSERNEAILPRLARALGF